MNSFKKILFATDLTKACSSISQKVHEIVTDNNAELHIIHAIESFPTYAWGYVDFQKIEDEVKKEAKSRLLASTDKFSIDQKNLHLICQPSKGAILELAKELKVDLIIVGSQSEHGFLGSLGSTASGVVNHAPCDVLVLKHE